MGATERAAIYTRVSTDRQEDNYSLPTQEARCRDHAAARGYQVVGVYTDVFSGAKYRERPGLTRLRQAVRDAGATVVLAYAVDRLSRNQAHLYILAEEIEEHGGRLEFVTEDFEDTAVGRFLRSAKAFAGEVQREKNIDNSIRGQEARVRSGKLLGAPRPLYGYCWRDAGHTALDIDPVTGPVVVRIFTEIVTGRSLRRVAQGLIASGIPSPTGREHWSRATIAGIIKHPNYTGDAFAHCWRPVGDSKTNRFDAEHAVPLPPNTVPTLVDRDLWESANRRLVLNRERLAGYSKDPNATLLRGGYVRCGYCGRSMTVGKQHNGKRTYVCNGRTDEPHPCSYHSINADILDPAVWAKVRDILTQPQTIAGELEKLRAADPVETDLAAIDRALERIGTEQKNLARTIASIADPDAAAPLVAQLQTLATQRRYQIAERDRALAERTSWLAAQDRLDSLTEWCHNVAANVDDPTREEQRLALDALGVGVRVWRNTDWEHERFAVTMRLPLGEEHASSVKNSFAFLQLVQVGWT